MSSACAFVFGKVFRTCHKPLIQHIVVRGKRSNAYFINQMRHRALLHPYEETHRNTHLEWNYDAEIYAFANRIGEKFNKQILETALIDRSHIESHLKKQKEAGIESKEILEDNSKLAETGKAILIGVADRYLRTVVPKFPDEGIKAVVDYLSSNQLAYKTGKGLGMDELVLTPDFPTPEEVVQKSFYALIGAVHESAGLERAAVFVRDLVIVNLCNMELNSLWLPDDPVQYLNFVFENEGYNKPEPRLIHQCGMHTILASYRVGMYLDRKYLGAGNGESVEEAVKFAALDVLWRRWGTVDGKMVIPFNLEPKVFLKTPSIFSLEYKTTAQPLLQSESATA